MTYGNSLPLYVILAYSFLLLSWNCPLQHGFTHPQEHNHNNDNDHSHTHDHDHSHAHSHSHFHNHNNYRHQHQNQHKRHKPQVSKVNRELYQKKIKQKQKELQQNDKNYLQNIKQLFEGCRKQLVQWVGYNQKTSTQQLLSECKIINDKSQGDKNQLMIQILTFYKDLANTGKQFNKTHIDTIRFYLKDHPLTKQALSCLIQKRQTENQYFNEQRKYKYLAQFIREHTSQGKDVLVTAPTMHYQKGKRLCSFFKGFFQYYYLNILNPSQTISTAFLRALTVRSDIFNHQDIAHCVSLQTHGDLSTHLQNLDINNIYQKIPAALNALRYLKFKHSDICQSQSNMKMMKSLQEKLKDINMFKIMYHDYEPFVEIAAEKYGTTQLKLLARRIAHIIQNIQQFEKISNQEL